MSLGLLFALGCSRRASEPETSESKSVETDLPDELSKPTLGTDDPAAALELLIRNVAAGDSESVIDAVPAAYLNDLESFIASRVKTVEPSMRRDLADSVVRFAAIVREKQGYVVNSDRVAFEGIAGDWIRAHLAEVSKFVGALASWPGWDNDQTLNARTLLAAAVTALTSEEGVANELRDLEVIEHSRSTDSALIAIRDARGGSQYEVELDKVGERWVPATLAMLWKQFFRSEAKPGVATSDATLRDLSQQLDNVTRTLESVSSQAEFDAAADRASTLLLATLAQSDPPPRKVSPEEFVTVEVQGELTEQQKDEVLWSLAMATDSPPSAQAYSSDRLQGPGMVANVGPIADLAEFARRFKGLSIEKIDPEKRTITARLKTP